MPYGADWAQCPNCGKQAQGQEEIEEKFGYRNMGDGRHIPQSHCRECRLKELEEKIKHMFETLLYWNGYFSYNIC